MRVLVIGVTGQLGHKVYQVLKSRGMSVMGTTRRPELQCQIFDPCEMYLNVDVSRLTHLQRVLTLAAPDVVVNCAGIVRQVPAYRNVVQTIMINALFPQQLAAYCKETGTRMIHISSDCVWDGKRGNYRDYETPNGTDLYAHTKILGEVGGAHCLTLRTSFIGRELEGNAGLLEWFLSNAGGEVNGWVHAYFSGLTSLALARLIGDVIENHPDLDGIWQVSSKRISKHDLLCLARDAFGANIEINPSPEPYIDRSLDSMPFREVTGFKPQTWLEMMAELAADETPYDEIRKATS